MVYNRLQKRVYDTVYDRVDVYCCACATVLRVCGRLGGVPLATRSELDGVVVGDVTVPPQSQARALGVLLRHAVISHKPRQSDLAQGFHQHQALFDQVLNANSIDKYVCSMPTEHSEVLFELELFERLLKHVLNEKATRFICMHYRYFMQIRNDFMLSSRATKKKPQTMQISITHCYKST